jgi:hypothetical protein
MSLLIKHAGFVYADAVAVREWKDLFQKISEKMDGGNVETVISTKTNQIAFNFGIHGVEVNAFLWEKAKWEAKLPVGSILYGDSKKELEKRIKKQFPKDYAKTEFSESSGAIGRILVTVSTLVDAPSSYKKDPLAEKSKKKRKHLVADPNSLKKVWKVTGDFLPSPFYFLSIFDFLRDSVKGLQERLKTRVTGVEERMKQISPVLEQSRSIKVQPTVYNSFKRLSKMLKVLPAKSKELARFSIQSGLAEYVLGELKAPAWLKIQENVLEEFKDYEKAPERHSAFKRFLEDLNTTLTSEMRKSLAAAAKAAFQLGVRYDSSWEKDAKDFCDPSIEKELDTDSPTDKEKKEAYQIIVQVSDTFGVNPCEVRWIIFSRHNQPGGGVASATPLAKIKILPIQKKLNGLWLMLKDRLPFGMMYIVEDWIPVFDKKGDIYPQLVHSKVRLPIPDYNRRVIVKGKTLDKMQVVYPKEAESWSTNRLKEETARVMVRIFLHDSGLLSGRVLQPYLESWYDKADIEQVVQSLEAMISAPIEFLDANGKKVTLPPLLSDKELKDQLAKFHPDPDRTAKDYEWLADAEEMVISKLTNKYAKALFERWIVDTIVALINHKPVSENVPYPIVDFVHRKLGKSPLTPKRKKAEVSELDLLLGAA